jgi:hypothetical protein
MRASKGSKTGKIGAWLEALVKVAPEKPANATVSLMPRDLAQGPLGAQHHVVGAREGGALRELDHHDGVTLVLHRMKPCGTVRNMNTVRATRPP